MLLLGLRMATQLLFVRHGKVHGARVRMLAYPAMSERWVYSTSTSCNDIVFSPDSTQVAAGYTYYQSDGASIRIYAHACFDLRVLSTHYQHHGQEVAHLAAMETIVVQFMVSIGTQTACISFRPTGEMTREFIIGR